MDRAGLRTHPLVATFLGAVVTGMGHLYLQRYHRALGWLIITAVTAVVFVPAHAVEAIVTGGAADPFAMLPVFAISIVSTFDAYLLATVRKRTQVVDADGTLARCPACGGELDPELGFCHWCTTEFDTFRIVRPNTAPNENNIK